MRKIKPIPLDKAKDLDPARIQVFIDADLKRTTEQTKELLDVVWGWTRNGRFDLATKNELAHLNNACEKAEHAIYQREIVERTYQEYKRSQSHLTANDWREMVKAIQDAEYDTSGHELAPDWQWFINNVLGLTQCQCKTKKSDKILLIK